MKFISPHHKFFNQIHIDNYQKKYFLDNYYRSRFFNFINHHEAIKKEICEITQKIIIPSFKININLNPYDDDTLVLHIRSGDIWSNNSNKDYVQNPLIYYLKLIKKFKKVLLVTEPDMKNPVIKKLLELDKVELKSKNLIEDIKTILKAKNFSSSGVGTFGIALSLISKNIKNFYFSNLYLNEHLNPSFLKYKTNLKLHKININNYLSEWNNTFLDNKILLEHNDISQSFKAL